MTVNQLKNELEQLIEKGFGNNRIMLTIDDGIRSALNEVNFYKKKVKGVEETFIILHDNYMSDEDMEDYE